MGEQVGGDHFDHQAIRRAGVPKSPDDAVAGCPFGAERDQIVVVEGDSPGTSRSEAFHRLNRVKRSAGCVAEWVASLPSDGPQSEGEEVGGRGSWGHRPGFRGLGGFSRAWAGLRWSV